MYFAETNQGEGGKIESSYKVWFARVQAIYRHTKKAVVPVLGAIRVNDLTKCIKIRCSYYTEIEVGSVAKEDETDRNLYPISCMLGLSTMAFVACDEKESSWKYELSHETWEKFIDMATSRFEKDHAATSKRTSSASNALGNKRKAPDPYAKEYNAPNPKRSRRSTTVHVEETAAADET